MEKVGPWVPIELTAKKMISLGFVMHKTYTVESDELARPMDLHISHFRI